MPPPFVASVSRWRTFCLAALGFGLVVCFLLITGAFGDAQPRGSQGVSLLIGSMGILLFGVFTLRWLKNVVVGGDAITVDYRGIRARQWSDKFIPWTSIIAVDSHEVRIGLFYSQYILSLKLADAHNYPPTRLMRSAKLSRFWGYGDLSFNTIDTDKSYWEVADAIERHWHHYRGTMSALDLRRPS